MPGEKGGVFIYAKRNFISSDIASAQQKLRFCQKMTKLGALFPDTKWGIFQRESGQFQVFAVTRKLELALPSEDPLRNSKILRERLGSDYDDIIDDGEANRNPMGHLPESKDLYPVDIEVITLGFDEREAIKREVDYQNKSSL